jgi:hypothetical protein
VIVEARGGAVLGALTILKEDYFPGMKSNRLPQLLPGGARGVACCCVRALCSEEDSSSCVTHATHHPPLKPTNTGAGNFRRMAGPPVYGVAMCTSQGIRNVLAAVHASQAAAAAPDAPRKVCVGGVVSVCVCAAAVDALASPAVAPTASKHMRASCPTTTTTNAGCAVVQHA